tara:strand:- start:123 stop:1130 length:1008 start_codon:yes stop_codon:yes gene_type:complete
MSTEKTAEYVPGTESCLTDAVRAGCAQVMEQARHVHIRSDLIPAYAERISSYFPYENLWHAAGWHFRSGSDEALAAYVLTLDSINFGSGYFSALEKREGMSGYATIASWLTDRFQENPLTAHDLKNMSAKLCADIFHQNIANPEMLELMERFAKAMSETGRQILEHYDGKFLNLVISADHSAVGIAASLAKFPQYADIAHYHGFAVPFYKRAQIAAADIYLAFEGQRAGALSDLEKLTIFADNAVPHVLRMEGVLEYSEALAAKIDAEELLEAGSEEEVELRAAAIHAGDMIVAALHALGQTGVTAMNLDHYIWDHSHRPEYQSKPRHRTQTVYY